MKEKIARWDDPNIEWLCEQHPSKDFEHREFPRFWRRCIGPGMPVETTYIKVDSQCPSCGYYCTGKTAFCTKHPDSPIKKLSDK